MVKHIFVHFIFYLSALGQLEAAMERACDEVLIKANQLFIMLVTLLYSSKNHLS